MRQNPTKNLSPVYWPVIADIGTKSVFFLKASSGFEIEFVIDLFISDPTSKYLSFRIIKFLHCRKSRVIS